MAICTATQTQCAWLRLLPEHPCPCTTASPWTMRELPNDIPSLLLARSRRVWVTREPFIHIYVIQDGRGHDHLLLLLIACIRHV